MFRCPAVPLSRCPDSDLKYFDTLEKMLAIRDNLNQCYAALRSNKLRASLTMLGLTLGVATLITVMTIVQGANVYVEQKIANLGTDVFQFSGSPFSVTALNFIIKARMKLVIELCFLRAV